MTPFSLVAALCLGTARAEEAPSAVLVPPFEARSREAAGLAALLPGFLAEELARHPELRTVPMDAVGPVSDTPAAVYAASCPPGQFVGCAFVLGEAAKADYSVAGTVESIVTGTLVEIHIIDVARAEDALSFQVELGMGDDSAFAEGVARIVVAVVKGEAGGGGDIRQAEAVQGPDAGKNAVAASELDQLSREIGDVTTLDRREGVRIDRPKTTIEQIVEESRTDAAKPWDRVDMTAREYLRYRNSGLALHEWKKRAQGRKAQLLARPFIGVGRGPVDGRYNGRYARDAQTLQVVETWSWQAVDGGAGVHLGGSVGYGILPELEVGLAAGLAWGRYEVQIHGITVGQTTSAPPAEEYGNRSLWGGPQVLFAPMPASNLRPVLGARLAWWRGTAVDSHVMPPSGLETFAPPGLGLAALVLGGEARLSQRLDAFVHVPITAVVAGEGITEAHVGAGSLETDVDPPAMPTTGASLVIGLQARFLGPRKRTGLDAYEDEP